MSAIWRADWKIEFPQSAFCRHPFPARFMGEFMPFLVSQPVSLASASHAYKE
jgi:hypothetical protein